MERDKIELWTKMGIIITTIIMIAHIIYFHPEISNLLNATDFRVPTQKNFKGIISFGENLANTVKDYGINKYNEIDERIDWSNFDPIGLYFSLFKWVEKEVAEKSTDLGWGEFIGSNLLILMLSMALTMAIVTIIGSIISSVVAGGILALITAIPALIMTLLGIVVIIIMLTIFIIVFIPDNATYIIECAHMKKPIMTNYDNFKKRMCNFWLHTSAPAIIPFPTIYGKRKDIRIIEVIKNEDNEVIKVVLPGNVIYDVDREENVGVGDFVRNEKIYIRSGEKLKKNDKIFDDDDEDGGGKFIWNHKKTFNAFKQDYKDNIVKYYAYNNIFYMLFYPYIVIPLIVGIYIFARSFFSPYPTEGTKAGCGVEPWQVIAFVSIIKSMMVVGPMKHFFWLITQFDLIKEPDMMNIIIFLMFELVVFLGTGVPIIISIIMHDPKMMNMSVRFSIPMILLYIAITYELLIGDILHCNLEDKSKCKITVYTDKNCQKKNINNSKSPFMNFSNNNIKNLDYTNVIELFSESPTIEPDEEVVTIEPDEEVVTPSPIPTMEEVQELGEEITNNILKAAEGPFAAPRARKMWVKLNNCSQTYTDATADFFVSWGKMMIGKAKLKDYITIKRLLFIYMVMTIILSIIISVGWKHENAEAVRFFPDIKDFPPQLIPLANGFMVFYYLFILPGFAGITFSDKEGKEVLPVLLTLVPDLIVLVSLGGYVMT